MKELADIEALVRRAERVGGRLAEPIRRIDEFALRALGRPPLAADAFAHRLATMLDATVGVPSRP